MKKLDRTPTTEAIDTASRLDCGFVMLGHGRFALVSREDIARVSQWIWNRNGRGYAARLQWNSATKSERVIYLHRFILNAAPGTEYDHANRDKLDCRRCNLRLATHAQNNMNVGKRHKNTTSKFKGVHWCKERQQWRSQGKAGSKRMWIGSFENEIDAATAYNAWALKHCGEFAYQNPL